MSTLTRDHLTLLQTAPLTQDVQAFLVDCQARSLSPRTVEAYRFELDRFCEYMRVQHATETPALTPDLVRRYLLDLGQTRNPGGVHLAYRVIKTFLRWYEREYEPEGWQNPMAKVRPPKLP
ncbi:MAG: site-specific integrase, partial [Anaerolineae bacterium]